MTQFYRIAVYRKSEEKEIRFFEDEEDLHQGFRDVADRGLENITKVEVYIGPNSQKCLPTDTLTPLELASYRTVEAT